MPYCLHDTTFDICLAAYIDVFVFGFTKLENGDFN